MTDRNMSKHVHTRLTRTTLFHVDRQDTGENFFLLLQAVV